MKLSNLQPVNSLLYPLMAAISVLRPEFFTPVRVPWRIPRRAHPRVCLRWLLEVSTTVS
jgi:hypothetical protein